jgi:hypothetical protein
VRDLPFLTRMLLRTQRMMHPGAYLLLEHLLAESDRRVLPVRANQEPLAD